MNAYRISREGQELGSFETSQLQEGLQTGYFLPTDWGWSEGMAEWTPLSELLGTATQPVTSAPAVSAAPKARPVASPQSVGVKKAPGAATTGLNPYAAPVAAQGGALVGAVPFPIVAELSGTKPWVRLISILMWIGCGFVILAILGNLIFVVLGASALAQEGKAGAGIGGLAVMMIFMGITALLVLYPTIKLSKYASSIGRLAESKSFTDLTVALAEQRRFWKFYGIITLIYLCIVLLFVLLMFAGVGITSMSMSR